MTKSPLRKKENADFAFALKQMRNKMLMYQAPFAEMINVSLSTLRGWERGYNLPSQENFNQMICNISEKGFYTRTLENEYINARSKR